MNRRSFSLIEAMVAVAILSFGVVLLYQSFLINTGSVASVSNGLSAGLWAQEKLWQEEDSFHRLKVVIDPQETGQLNMNGRDFFWEKSAIALDEGLYALTLTLSWRESTRDRRVVYASYLGI